MGLFKREKRVENSGIACYPGFGIGYALPVKTGNDTHWQQGDIRRNGAANHHLQEGPTIIEMHTCALGRKKGLFRRDECFLVFAFQQGPLFQSQEKPFAFQ